jgi:pimeloyl-ACP methyl ester carboxylesterase
VDCTRACSRLPWVAVLRRLLLVVTVALAAAGPASAWSKQDLAIPMDDGVALAATLYLPDGAAPAGGRPALVFLHGLNSDRSSTNGLAESYGFVGEDYAVLTFDARGHGQSGGLVGIDGPREVADTRAVFAWLRDRPDVADGRIGAWGISYGGGAVLNSLVAGVPWAAVEVAETWTDLATALMPQGVAKSGVVAVFVNGIPQARRDPSLDPIVAASFAGQNLGAVRTWAAARSSLPKLESVRTPIFFMQGRRDFAFGLDQATVAFAKVKGPKKLWIGNHGHSPSGFPAADTKPMLAEGRRWFDRFLRNQPNGVEKPPVLVAREGKATTRAYVRIPATRRVAVSLFPPGRTRTIGPAGKVQLRFRLPRATEVFGAPTVEVQATAAGGWSRLVAVLSARTPAGKEIVVSAGAVPPRPGAHIYEIRLLDQATFVPARSTFTLTLGSSSLRQHPNNLLYLDLPLPPAARLTIGTTTVSLPTLPAPISG